MKLSRTPSPSQALTDDIRESRPERRRIMLVHFDYYDAATHRGIVEWVREHDWSLDASMVRFRELPRIATVDGILITVSRPGSTDWLRKFNCPIVRMHAVPSAELLAGCSDFPAVEGDFTSIGRLGAEHLLTLGRPHFVFYQRGQGEDVMALRKSFVGRLRAAGHEPTIVDFCADHQDRDPLQPTTLEQRLAWLTERLRSLPRPMAIMTEDDRFAPDIIEAARILKLRVPTDIAVLGCDDNALCHGVSPIPISSVDSNNFGVGYAAAGLLAGLIEGQPPPKATIYVPARRVLMRQSTATYAGSHAGVSAALRHLRQNFQRKLPVELLARDVGLSVRGLEVAFRKELGCSIQEELRRLRVTAATRLLEETDLKLDAVAAETNLGDAKNLCRVFAKMHGITPDAWRRLHRDGR